MRAFEGVMVAFFVEWLGGKKTNRLGDGWLEESAVFGVGRAVGWEGLAEGEES